MGRIALLALVIALLVGGCGGSADTTGSADTAVTARLDDGFSVRLTIPNGWALSSDGVLVVAQDAGDLAIGVTPSGPRIVIGQEEDVMAAAFSLLPEGSSQADAEEDLEVVDGPSDIDVAGYRATTLTLRERATIRQYTVVFHDGAAHLVVAEAPAASWRLHEQGLRDIVATSLHFTAPVEPDDQSDEPAPATSAPPVKSTTAAPTTTQATTTTTTTSPPVVGYESPQMAMWVELGAREDGSLQCAYDPEAQYECYDDFLDRVDGDATTPAGDVYAFRRVWNEWYWVLITEPAEGRFVVAEVVPMPEDANAFEHPFPG